MAQLVFQDPHSITQRDELSFEEERWLTLGSIKGVLVLLVVHIWEESVNEETIRIISARKATPREREAYESQRKSP